mmetsp:Transcript_94406/g.152286  ORF Transcript_94406/g.152286 Transcript_94406/m.152286 type:complete len:119 (+) Transcript_94406:602-958(+)
MAQTDPWGQWDLEAQLGEQVRWAIMDCVALVVFRAFVDPRVVRAFLEWQACRVDQCWDRKVFQGPWALQADQDHWVWKDCRGTGACVGTWVSLDLEVFRGKRVRLDFLDRKALVGCQD